MTNGNDGGVVKTAVTSIADNLKGSPLAFALVVINAIFIVVVIFLLWHVSSAVERRDEIIQKFIERCVSQKTGAIYEYRDFGGPWSASQGSISDPR